MSNGMNQPPAIRLDSKTWIWLVTVIAGASAANIGGMFKIKADLQHEMVEIERRWVDRVTGLGKEFDDKLLRLASQIPPPEVRYRLDSLDRKTTDLEKRIDVLERNGGP